MERTNFSLGHPVHQILHSAISFLGNANRILIGKPLGKYPLGSVTGRREDS
jgi:hypothetical protein